MSAAIYIPVEAGCVRTDRAKYLHVSNDRSRNGTVNAQHLIVTSVHPARARILAEYIKAPLLADRLGVSDRWAAIMLSKVRDNDFVATERLAKRLGLEG